MQTQYSTMFYTHNWPRHANLYPQCMPTTSTLTASYVSTLHESYTGNTGLPYTVEYLHVLSSHSQGLDSWRLNRGGR